MSRTHMTATRQRDITGLRIGTLVAVRRCGTRRTGAAAKAVWLWACDCGGSVEEVRNVLDTRQRRGLAVGCPRCRLKKRRPRPRPGPKPTAVRAGSRWGLWTVVRVAGYDAERHQHLDCRCVCGREETVRASHLRRGASRSCVECARLDPGGPDGEWLRRELRRRGLQAQDAMATMGVSKPTLWRMWSRESFTQRQRRLVADKLGLRRSHWPTAHGFRPKG